MWRVDQWDWGREWTQKPANCVSSCDELRCGKTYKQKSAYIWSVWDRNLLVTILGPQGLTSTHNSRSSHGCHKVDFPWTSDVELVPDDAWHNVCYLFVPPCAHHSAKGFLSSLQKPPAEGTHGSLPASLLFPQALLTFQLFGDSLFL